MAEPETMDSKNVEDETNTGGDRKGNGDKEKKGKMNELKERRVN